jgi:hypothetical protein
MSCPLTSRQQEKNPAHSTVDLQEKNHAYEQARLPFFELFYFVLNSTILQGWDTSRCPLSRFVPGFERAGNAVLVSGATL